MRQQGAQPHPPIFAFPVQVRLTLGALPPIKVSSVYSGDEGLASHKELLLGPQPACCRPSRCCCCCSCHSCVVYVGAAVASSIFLVLLLLFLLLVNPSLCHWCSCLLPFTSLLLRPILRSCVHGCIFLNIFISVCSPAHHLGPCCSLASFPACTLQVCGEPFARHACSWSRTIQLNSTFWCVAGVLSSCGGVAWASRGKVAI